MQRFYLLALLALWLIAAACIAAFCFVIDPYEIYPNSSGLSPKKRADLFYHLRLHKPYALVNTQAEHLIIGSSRAARLPPETLGTRSYNTSLPGITLKELRLMVEHAQAISPLKTLYVSVDYYMFRPGNSERTEHFKQARLRKTQGTIVDTLANWIQRVEDRWQSLFSVGALIDSTELLIGTKTSQRIYHSNGTWEIDVPQKSPKWLYSTVNRQKLQDFSSDTGELVTAEFEQLLEFCVLHNISTTVIISPFHGSVMNTINMAERWENYLAWQREVSDIGAAYSKKIRVVGIEANSHLVLEPMLTHSPFFLDGVHYTSAAGEKIMDCLANSNCNAQLKVFPLGPKTIDSYLDTVNKIMQAYPEANPQDFESLTKWLKKGRNPNG